MKRLCFSVLLPVLFCAVILTFGFFSPDLYHCFYPDQLGVVTEIPILTQDDPIYLKSSITTEYYPLNRIHNAHAVPLSAEELAETLTDESLLESFLSAFLPGELDMETFPMDSAYLSEPFLFWERAPIQDTLGNRFHMTFVLDLQLGCCTYLYISNDDAPPQVFADAAAHYQSSVFFPRSADADAFTDALQTILNHPVFPDYIRKAVFGSDAKNFEAQELIFQEGTAERTGLLLRYPLYGLNYCLFLDGRTLLPMGYILEETSYSKLYHDPDLSILTDTEAAVP